MTDDEDDAPETTEVHDQPLGVQEDGPDEDEAPSPGFPEAEPPASG